MTNDQFDYLHSAHGGLHGATLMPASTSATVGTHSVHYVFVLNMKHAYYNFGRSFTYFKYALQLSELPQALNVLVADFCVVVNVEST